MTTHSRIAAFLSTSALCLGLATAPAFAAQGDTAGATKAAPAKSASKAGHHKHAKSKTQHHAKAADSKSDMAK